MAIWKHWETGNPAWFTALDSDCTFAIVCFLCAVWGFVVLGGWVGVCVCVCLNFDFSDFECGLLLTCRQLPRPCLLETLPCQTSANRHLAFPQLLRACLHLWADPPCCPLTWTWPLPFLTTTCPLGSWLPLSRCVVVWAQCCFLFSWKKCPLNLFAYLFIYLLLSSVELSCFWWLCPHMWWNCPVKHTCLLMCSAASGDCAPTCGETVQ